jgi:methionyl-tRNA formyltransferase
LPEAGGAGQSIPGTFLGFTRDGGIRVQCGNGTVLEIIEVQPASKRPITGREFAIGARLALNEVVFGTSTRP